MGILEGGVPSGSPNPNPLSDQKPITLSKQLPYSAYVTAILWNSLFLDTFEGTFSRENRISTMSMCAIEVQDIKKEN